ncbi:ABC-type Zn/Mn transport system periplasmic component/surface adhesion [Candidatus Phytoplasma australiense]|uniref:ABC-type Zn/Mn transport system periplasmic component/surface adhesion n=1 Tax=Phytoplasma australiense TaxID=59748 RepID=B1VA42_PHYAS|nr:ABC-type Zn/Mn transport system periplasmic component/surface adhesion [Candidatus Phytoplasma australiense]
MIPEKEKKQKFIVIFLILIITFFILVIPVSAFYSKPTKQDENTKKIVVTTTMLQDLVKHLIGDVDKEETQKSETYQKIEGITCETLMGVGIDPHNYKIKLSDRLKLKNADLVVVSGLHLEAKMPEAFQRFTKQDRFWDAGNALIKDSELKNLLKQTDSYEYDPHIWFEIDLWIETFKNLKQTLLDKKIVKEKDKKKLEANFGIYNKALEQLKEKIINEMIELKINLNNKLIIVTAHDAFAYWESFCQKQKKNCDFDLESIQGISTQTEASNNKIVALAEKLVKNDVKAIFTESSMPKNSLQSLKEQVDSERRRKGLQGEIQIPENMELYSDSLGTDKQQEELENNKYKHSTYIGAFLNNIKVIKTYLSPKTIT